MLWVEADERSVAVSGGRVEDLFTWMDAKHYLPIYSQIGYYEQRVFLKSTVNLALEVG
jgi:hypothetical protein